MQVVASDYGQRLPWYFPFQRSYWRPSSRPGNSKPPGAGAGGAADDEAADGARADVAIAIKRLCKDFGTTDGATKRAVDNLTLDVPAQQITALLGELFLKIWNELGMKAPSGNLLCEMDS